MLATQPKHATWASILALSALCHSQLPSPASVHPLASLLHADIVATVSQFDSCDEVHTRGSNCLALLAGHPGNREGMLFAIPALGSCLVQLNKGLPMYLRCLRLLSTHPACQYNLKRPVRGHYEALHVDVDIYMLCYRSRHFRRDMLFLPLLEEVLVCDVWRSRKDYMCFVVRVFGHFWDDRSLAHPSWTELLLDACLAEKYSKPGPETMELLGKYCDKHKDVASIQSKLRALRAKEAYGSGW